MHNSSNTPAQSVFLKWLSFLPIFLLLFMVFYKSANRVLLKDRIQQFFVTDTFSSNQTTPLSAQSQDILQKMESWQTAYNDSKLKFTSIAKAYRGKEERVELGRVIHELEEAYQTLLERYPNEIIVIKAVLEQVCNEYGTPAQLTEKGVRYKER